MTVYLKTSAPFGHSDIKNLRLLLKSYGEGWLTLQNLVDTPLFGGDEKDVLAILHEAMEAGLVDIDADKGRMDLTDAGLAVAVSKAGRRFSKTEGMEILDSIRSKVIALNADAKSPLTVKEIWLFGSMLDDDVTDVGDVDIVVETETKNDQDGNPIDLFSHIHREFPGLVTTAFWESYMIGTHFLKKMIFGARRRRRFRWPSCRTS
jgi:hypothetical protein